MIPCGRGKESFRLASRPYAGDPCFAQEERCCREAMLRQLRMEGHTTYLHHLELSEDLNRWLESPHTAELVDSRCSFLSHTPHRLNGPGTEFEDAGTLRRHRPLRTDCRHFVARLVIH